MTAVTRVPDYGWKCAWMVPLAYLLATTWAHWVAATTGQPNSYLGNSSFCTWGKNTNWQA